MITTFLLPSLVAALPAPAPATTVEPLVLPSYLELMSTPLVTAPTTTLSPAASAPLQDDDYRGDDDYRRDDDNRWDDDYDFSYTFLEVGFTETDLDAFDVDDPQTYYIDGSIGIGIFQIVAGYSNTELDFGDSDTDVFRLGIGAHFELADRLDLQGDISWLYSDTSSRDFDLDDDNNGYEVRVGPRWLALPWSGGGLELAGNLMYRDIEGVFASDDGQFGYEIEGRVHFINLLSLGLSWIDYDGDQSYLINGRVSF